MAGPGIEVKADLSKMSAELKSLDKKFATAARRRIRAALTESGSELLAEARTRASWSSRIPGAMKIKTSFSATNAKVQIVVNHSTAPHARPIELGNRTSFDEGEVQKRIKTVHGVEVGRRRAQKAMKSSGVGVGRQLRHPVWGHGDKSKWPWATMATRPFFFPAAAQESPKAIDRMTDTLDQIARDAGFH